MNPDKARIDLRKLSNNINTIKENLQLMRSIIRGAIGFSRPRLIDIVNFTAQQQRSNLEPKQIYVIDASKSPSNNTEESMNKEIGLAPTTEKTPQNVLQQPQPEEEKPKLITTNIPRLGIVDALRDVLSESAKQVKLKTQLMEAQVKYYQKQLEQGLREEERKRRGIHY